MVTVVGKVLVFVTAVADLLPGLTAVGLPISFHDPEQASAVLPYLTLFKQHHHADCYNWTNVN